MNPGAGFGQIDSVRELVEESGSRSLKLELVAAITITAVKTPAVMKGK